MSISPLRTDINDDVDEEHTLDDIIADANIIKEDELESDGITVVNPIKPVTDEIDEDSVPADERLFLEEQAKELEQLERGDITLESIDGVEE